MKFVSGEDTIEGSPEEIATFLKLQRDTKQRPTKTTPTIAQQIAKDEEPKIKKIYATRKKKRKLRTQEQTAILLEKAKRLAKRRKLSASRACIMIFGYANTPIINDIKKYIEKETGKPYKAKGRVAKYKKIKSSGKKPRAYTLNTEQISAKRKRMNFIHSRIKTLMHNNAMNYNKAFKIASEEYQNKGKTIRVATTKPYVAENKSVNDSVLDVLKHIVQNGNGKMMYDPDGKMLGLNLESWRSLTENIFAQFHNLSAYFGVPNKFKVIRQDHRSTVIKYGG